MALTSTFLKMNEAEIANAGIGRKFQKPTVIECLTVWQNLELAMSGVRSVWGTFTAVMNGEQKDKLLSVLELIHLHEEATNLSRVICLMVRSSGWKSACC